MKKAILIPWIIALILFYNVFLDKPKASGISSTNYFNNAYNSSGTVLNNSLVFGDGQVIAYNNSQTQIYFNNQHAIGGNGIAITSGLQTSYVVFMIALQSSSEVQQTQQSISIISRWSRNQGSLVSSSFCDINFYNYEFGRPENQNGSTIYANVYCPVPITNETLYITRLDIQNNATADVFQTFHINRNITILLNENYILQQGQQGTTNAINEQTQQQQQQHNEMMNQTQQYDDETNTNINGANETIEYEQAESQLIESLDVNESIMQDIFINPQASAFIWNIADQLRNMNPSIIILMTSILGIGIFKLILNR